MRNRRGRIAALGLAAAATAAGVAVAAPSNGGFEKGTFKGWSTFEDGGGNWSVYKGKFAGEPGPRGGGMSPATLQRPPRGKFAAGLEQDGPGFNVLHRKLTAKGNGTKLKFLISYRNTVDDFVSPNSFEYENGAPKARGGIPNQQVRVDLIDPDAPIDTLEKADIIEKVLRTKPGDKRYVKYMKVSVPVKGKFRLRIAEVDNQGVLLVGVDNVKLKRKN